MDPERVVRSWISTSTKPVHVFGRRIRSAVGDWRQIPKGFAFPEPVKEADAVIIVGGWAGTHYAASWARLANKPLLPVATFGGAAIEIFNDEIGNDVHRRNTNFSNDEFQTLYRILSNYEEKTLHQFAEQVVSLAEKAVLSDNVFIVMSFDEKPYLKDAFNTFKRVCEKRKLVACKIDHHIDTKRKIVPSIFSNIKNSRFVIAEVSGAKPNVFYEIGYARALGKAVIQTAIDGTVLPFDVFDDPTIFWDSQDTLENRLIEAIDREISS